LLSKLHRTTLAGIAAVLALAGCGTMGKVEQGRVIAYNPQTRLVTLIPDPGVLPPVTVEAPSDPSEMGPAPVAGGLMLLDAPNRRIVIYDPATHSLRTVQYTTFEERTNIAKNPGPPVVDRVKKTITIYAPKDRALITFAASDDLLTLPASTWRSGDVVRYYYKEPAQALRMMNVTRTDLSKSAG
jgi:hypothetical protein